MVKKKEDSKNPEKKPKVNEEDEIEEDNEETQEDEEEDEVEEIEEDFSFSEGILGTNKQVNPKKIRNLEEEIKDEEEIKEKDEDEEDLGKDYRGKREKEDGEEDEDTENKNILYGSSDRSNSDFYEGGVSDAYNGSRDEVYSSGQISSRTGPSNFMGASYNAPKENKTSELDRVSLPKQSGLEEIGRKADKVKMSYGNRSKKDGISYN